MTVINLYFLIFSKLELNYLQILSQLTNTQIFVKKINYQKLAVLQFSNINLFKFFYFKIKITEMAPLFFSISTPTKINFFAATLMSWFMLPGANNFNYLLKIILIYINNYLKKIFLLIKMNLKYLNLLQYMFFKKND
eukprot:TRINITY_DN208_c0_g1_i6.p1 TRINITY_DN208_c0_g1~~TRINITY_DN208_c0_g1_i6.p1  ORF type:complete len:137 (+),score=9.42 TRINITY_DN208_c0_g1_i6:100-510(+)